MKMSKSTILGLLIYSGRRFTSIRLIHRVAPKALVVAIGIAWGTHAAVGCTHNFAEAPRLRTHVKE